MNLHQLECFLQVAETLNFASAAKALNISQPAVSRQIHALEEDLGVELFYRTTRSVSLTAYGQNFLPDAQDIRNRMLAAYARVHHDMNVYVPVLSIGYSMSVDLDFMTLMLERCRQEMPDLHPFIQVLSRKRLINMLLKEDMDAAFGFKEDFQDASELTFVHLYYVEICCVVAAFHPLAARKSVTLETLYSEKAVLCYVSDLPSAVSNIQKQLEYRYAPSSFYYCHSITSTLAFIRAGYGYSILPDLQSRWNPGIECVPLEGYQPLSYGIYYKKGKKNPLLREFIRMIHRE